jgi:flagellar assembly protein FliH
MASPEPIALSAPLRDVQLRTDAGRSDAGTSSFEAERAAYERGRRDGESALNEQLLQQRAELLALHQGVVESLRAALPRISQDVQQALVELALESAQKLVAGLPISAKMMEAVVREAVSQAEEGAEITIQLHPDDLALLRKYQSPILQGFPETGPLRLTHSGEVTRGGCLVRTRFGSLDARRETKMEQLRQALAL